MSRPVWVEYKTARCILWSGDRVLLAVHHSYMPFSSGRWGLPGGRIEIGESAEAAARREVGEELSIEIGELLDCGDYRLVRRVAPRNEGAIDWLLACPRKGFFVTLDSESTDAL